MHYKEFINAGPKKPFPNTMINKSQDQNVFMIDAGNETKSGSLFIKRRNNVSVF